MSYGALVAYLSLEDAVEALNDMGVEEKWVSDALVKLDAMMLAIWQKQLTKDQREYLSDRDIAT